MPPYPPTQKKDILDAYLLTQGLHWPYRTQSADEEMPWHSKTAVPRIWYLWATIILPISWWSPRQHWPLPAHLLHDVTTTVMMQQCIFRVRHDNVCVRLIFKHHLQSCSHQWMSTQSDHYAVLHPLLLEVCWILALEAQFQGHFGPQNRS